MGNELEFNSRIALTFSYLVFLFCLIFSRYSPDSSLNGTNGFSLFVYAMGFVVLIGTFGYYYFTVYNKNEEHKFTKIDFGLIALFVFFFLSIASARGAVRTIMVLVPSASIIVSFLAIMIFKNALKMKEGYGRIVMWAVLIFVVISLVFAGYYYFESSKVTAENYIPSPYTFQWQKAMAWVRNSTPENAVFAHWWDYGYWLQSMGERATVLDGGNAIGYWNYLMGRYALTGSSNSQALEFLYTHNATHFLIDSSDIGKYGAFSSIGSDVNYDRRSWIPTFIRDDKNSQETKNSTVIVFVGGSPLDEDIKYDINGTKGFIPAGSNSGLGAVKIEVDKNGTLISQPQGVYVYQRVPYALPLRYAYINNEFFDYGQGVEAGIFLMPNLVPGTGNQGGYSIQMNGALMYLSNRTVKSQLARLYLYNENNSNFELVHTEDEETVVAPLKANYGIKNDFINVGGQVTANGQINVGELKGPIKIWEIHYPSGIEANPDYLKTVYPDKRLTIA